MSFTMPSFFRRLRRDQSGAVAMMVGISIAALVGVGTLTVDLANVVNAQRTLQASSNAAALAGAQEIGSATANPNVTATTYSSVAGNKNARGNLTVTMTSVLKCFTSTGVTCTGSPLANGIVVNQQSTVSTYFGSMLGIGSVNISATATAGAKGGQSQPVDVMIIVDTTQSMNNSDSSCSISGASRLDCALAGVRALLSGFWPTVDQAGLMVFPGLTSATVSNDYDCSGSTPTVVAYNNVPAPVYLVIPLLADYRTSNTAPSLNTASNIVKAARGGASGCTQGISAVGGYGTFYADVIKSAQTTLTATGRPNVQKAIILLSDGDASANASNMPSGEANNQCHEAITAAATAKAAGTWVYSVAYGASTSSSSSCSSDSSPISACSTMQQIASDSSKFFSDTLGGTNSCTSAAQSVSDLIMIFQNIGTGLTSARLLSNNVT
jgi:Flp pilus assembly protein TadG